jgi:hypothetical protein
MARYASLIWQRLMALQSPRRGFAYAAIYPTTCAASLEAFSVGWLQTHCVSNHTDLVCPAHGVTPDP